MALYILSDLHLSESKPKPMDIFGSRWKNHKEKTVYNWYETIYENDTVIVGGDISWGINLEEAAEDLKLISSLPGKKIFLKGNHDYWWSTLTKINKFFKENGIDNISILQNNSISVEGFVICGSRGWYNDTTNAPRDAEYKKIVSRECIRLRLSFEEASKNEGEKICVFHFPPVFNDYICNEFIEILHEYDIKRCYFGHIHGIYKIPETFRFEGIEFTLTSADYLDFKPLLISHSQTPETI